MSALYRVAIGFDFTDFAPPFAGPRVKRNNIHFADSLAAIQFSYITYGIEQCRFLEKWHGENVERKYYFCINA